MPVFEILNKSTFVMFLSSFTTNDPQAMHMRPILAMFIHALYISSLLQICFEYTVGFWLVFIRLQSAVNSA